MSTVRRNLHTPAERNRAFALAVVVHLSLGLILLSGLAVTSIRSPARKLLSFDVTPVSPVELAPLPPTPRPQVAAASARPAAAASPAARAMPTPVMAPPPRVPLRQVSRVAVADPLAALAGNDPSAGAAANGAGSGAGGVGAGGNGSGGNGFGSGGGGGEMGSPARLLSGNLNRRDYRSIRSMSSPRGAAVLEIVVGAEGRLRDCRPILSSGDPALDSRLCVLLGRTAWAPARNPAGQPVVAKLRYVANWNQN